MQWTRSANVDITSANLLPAMKSYLRQPQDWDDTGIVDAAEMAIDYIESTAHITVFDATYVYRLDTLTDCIRLPRPPLTAVTSIVYDTTATTGITWPTTEYDVLTTSHPGTIRLAKDKELPVESFNVVITYTAGYGDEFKTLAPDIRHAIQIVTHEFYRNRGEVDLLRINPIVHKLQTGDEFIAY